MSLGTKYNQNYTTAGTKQFKTLSFVHYQYKGGLNLIPSQVYFDNNTLAPVTAVGTGTVTQVSTGRPLSGETVYSPVSNAPLVGEDRQYSKVVAVAADDGMQVAVKWDMSNDNYLTIVVKSSTASTSGKVRVTDSTGTAYSECTFTTGTAVNTWETFVFAFKDNTKANVTHTGSPDFSAIEKIQITVDTLGEDLSTAMIYGMNNQNLRIGQTVVIDFLTCPSGATLSDNLETTDLMCRQLTKRKIASGRAPTLELTHKATNLAQMGVSIGTQPKNTSAYRIQEIYSATQSSTAITGGIVNLSTGLILGKVAIGGQVKSPITDTILLDTNHYHYNSTTGVMTFDSSFNGQVPTIEAQVASNLDNLDVAGLELGYIGRMYVTRTTDAGREIYNTAYKAQISTGDTSGADDGDEITTNLSFLPDDSNRFYNVAVN